ncbi:TPA: eaa protein [Klebsiella oxytoca]|nr:eaa protein [Klebsiella oxytoca]
MPNPLKMYAVDAVAAIAEVRGWNACRAAMLQKLQKSAGDAGGAGGAGGVQISRGCRSNENMRDMQAGNSPVIPEGYVMVPNEPTEAMINAWLSEVANWRGHVAGYKAMLAAAPQEVKGE